MKDLKNKIIAFDIDGTLARNNTFPSDFTIQTIQRLIKEGYHITLVTGRNYISMIDIYQKCHLNSVCVLCNGALVYHPTTHEKLKNITIPFAILRNLLQDEGLMDKILDILVEIDDSTYSLTGKGWNNVNFIGDFNQTLPCEPNSLVFMVKDPSFQKEVAEIINRNPDYHYRYWSKIGEFYNVHFSKKEGVEVMLDYYHKTKEDLIFIGDGENDREIMQYAGFSIAMKNADELTKKKANQITKLTNEEDGAILHLLQMIAENE